MLGAILAYLGRPCFSHRCFPLRLSRWWYRVVLGRPFAAFEGCASYLSAPWAPASVESSRPEASANSPSSFDTPRQRQLKLRAASSLGPPRPASASWQVCLGWLAGRTGLASHIGAAGGSTRCRGRRSPTPRRRLPLRPAPRRCNARRAGPSAGCGGGSPDAPGGHYMYAPLYTSHCGRGGATRNCSPRHVEVQGHPRLRATKCAHPGSVYYSEAQQVSREIVQ